LRKEAAEEAKKIITGFMEISLGSSFELETQLLIARAVEFGEKDPCNNLMYKIIEEQKMLSSFMNSLKF
jgi:four helix bundle protein